MVGVFVAPVSHCGELAFFIVDAKVAGLSE